MGKDVGHPEVVQACQAAIAQKIAGVGVSPFNLKKAREVLRDSDVRRITCIGYPMGYSATTSKVEEIKRAINDGANQVDIALNYAAVKSEAWNYFENDIESSIRVAHLKNVSAFLIVENADWKEEVLRKVIDISIDKEVNGLCLNNLIDPIDTIDLDFIRQVKDISKGRMKIKVAAKNNKQIEALMEAGIDAIAVQSLDL